jgi:hypothetical protein
MKFSVSYLALASFVGSCLADCKYYQRTTSILLLLKKTSAVPFERLDKNNSMLLVLDLQDGLYSL